MTIFARFLAFLLLFPLAINAEANQPKRLRTSDLVEFASLSKERQKLVQASLDLASEYGWLRYRFGSNDPKSGGFDCSGAMQHLLAKQGLAAPRTSSDQFLWLKNNQLLRQIDPKKGFVGIEPGDLIFWTGTYRPTDGRKTKVTHVGMYLGREKSDLHPVMICASDGRSYRGKTAEGYGVFDLKIPSAKSKSQIAGYGPPPGLQPAGKKTDAPRSGLFRRP